MLNMEFISLTGDPLRLDSGKIVAVRSDGDAPEGPARCWIYVAGSHGAFLVNASYKDVLTRLEQKDTETDRHFVCSDEAVHVFGEVSIPTHAQWQEMSLAARMEWDRRYHMTGMMSMCCLTCGYPSGGSSTCPACRPEKEDTGP